MRRFVLAFIFCAFSFVCLAEDRIAIVGDSNEAKKVADLVSSSLSSVYAVQERGEIENILKEQKLSSVGIGSKEILALSKLLHVDFFITINSRESNKKTVPSRILLFDAANGFRLLDKTLPDNIEEAAKYSAEEIKKTLSGSHGTESKKLLSVLSVRNAGAPKKYEADFASIALEIERTLASSPDVAILERDNLGMLNQERKISESFSKLKTSAYLLDFEFLPGPEVSHVDMSLNILDSSGRQLSKITIGDCLKNPQKTIAEALSELSKFLSLAVPPNSVSDKKEAERFFNEYKFCARIDEFNAAERKLEAAIALNPDSPQYRIELASFLMKKAEKLSDNLERDNRTNTLLNAANRALNILEETQERFPDYKDRIYCLPLYPLEGILNPTWPFSSAMQQSLSEFSSRYRTHYIEEVKKRWLFDLSDGINSSSELQNFKVFCCESTRIQYFLDYIEAEKALFKAAEEFLRYGGEFLKKHPGLLTDMSYEKQVQTFSIPMKYYDAKQKQIKENTIINSMPIISAALEHPSPAVKALGIEIELLRKTLLNDFDPEKFSKDTETALNDMDRLNVKTDEDNYIFQQDIFDNIAIHNRKIGKIYYWKQIEHLRKSKKMASWLLLKNYIQISLTRKLTPISYEIEQIKPELTYWKNSKSRFRNEIQTYFQLWSSYMPKNKKEYANALEILRTPSSIRCETLFSIDHKKEWMTCVQQENGKLYLLTRFKREKFHIYSFDPLSSRIEIVGNSEKLFLDCSSYKNNHAYEVFCVSEKYFLVGGDKAILVIPRNGEEPYLIEDLPTENTDAITVMEGRIYVFRGRKNRVGPAYAKETVLASFLPDGSDRKIHISTLREEKEGFFDKKLPVLVRNLFADPIKKRLLFTATEPLSGLWEFYPETGKTKRLIDFGYYTGSWGIQLNNMLYLNANERFYTFDINSDKIDFVFFSGFSKQAKYIKGPKPQLLYQENVRHPFFSRKGQLWFNSSKVTFFNTNDISNPDYIEMPDKLFGIIGIFPHSDGVSVYAVTRTSIYKLTPQAATKE